MQREKEVQALEREWAENPRWHGLKRGYGAADVVRLRGSVPIEHTLAKRGAEKLWRLMHERPYVNSLGALTGNQAVQQVKAGVPAIYLSGWQVAADANDSLQMYPDQSLYAVSSVPTVVRRLNNALLRADQIQWMEGTGEVEYLAPIVASSRFLFQLKEGEQLYASILPGCAFCTASANLRAKSRSGLPVSHQTMSAYAA